MKPKRGRQEKPSDSNETKLGKKTGAHTNIHIERETKKRTVIKNSKATEIWHNTGQHTHTHTKRRGWRWPNENNCCFVNIHCLLLPLLPLWPSCMCLSSKNQRAECDRALAPHYNPSFRTLSHIDTYVIVSVVVFFRLSIRSNVIYIVRAFTCKHILLVWLVGCLLAFFFHCSLFSDQQRNESRGKRTEQGSFYIIKAMMEAFIERMFMQRAINAIRWIRYEK